MIVPYESAASSHFVREHFEPIAASSMAPATHGPPSIAPFPQELLAHVIASNSATNADSGASVSSPRTPARDNTTKVGRRSSSVIAERGSDTEAATDAQAQDGADVDEYPLYEFDDTDWAELAELDKVVNQAVLAQAHIAG
jgi:hypothetical protein